MASSAQLERKADRSRERLSDRIADLRYHKICILADAGFTLTRVHPIDQFLWSPHVELVGVFSR